MTIHLVTLFAVWGIVAFFVFAAYYIAKKILAEWEAASLRLWHAHAAFYTGLADGARAQFGRTVGGLPAKLGKEARAVTDDLARERGEEEEGTENV